MTGIIRDNAIFVDSTAALPSIRRSRACCFSGHRPEKLPQDTPRLEYLRSLTADTAAILYYKGVDTFITGMASGFDLMAGEAVAFDPDVGDRIKLVCALPYAEQRREMRTRADAALYDKLLERADMIICLSRSYFKECYRRRNEFMVNNSANLIAYVKDEKAMRTGTGMTCNLAEKAGSSLYIFNEEQLRG